MDQQEANAATAAQAVAAAILGGEPATIKPSSTQTSHHPSLVPTSSKRSSNTSAGVDSIETMADVPQEDSKSEAGKFYYKKDALIKKIIIVNKLQAL